MGDEQSPVKPTILKSLLSPFSRKRAGNDEKKDNLTEPIEAPLNVDVTERRELWRMIDNGSFHAFRVITGLGSGCHSTVVLVKGYDKSNRHSAVAKKFYALKTVAKPESQPSYTSVTSSADLSVERTRRRTHRVALRNELRIIQEIVCMTQLNDCPFLQQATLVFQTSAHIGVMTEYLPGGDLFFQLNQTIQSNLKIQQDNNLSIQSSPLGFPIEQTKLILAELVTALTHLHRHGYLHRDIKVENVMIDREGHMKIIDLSLAHPIDPPHQSNDHIDDPHTTAPITDDISPLMKSVNQYSHVIASPHVSSHQSMLNVKLNERYTERISNKVNAGECEWPPHRSGSLIYKSPELLLDGSVSTGTDWWSLGVLAYELHTGCVPWSSLTNLQLIVQQICYYKLNYPVYLSHESTRLLKGLLKRDYIQRLGTRNASQVMSQRFFKDINWDDVRNRRTPPPFTPFLNHSNHSSRDHHHNHQYHHNASSSNEASPHTTHSDVISPGSSINDVIISSPHASVTNDDVTSEYQTAWQSNDDITSESTTVACQYNDDITSLDDHPLPTQCFENSEQERVLQKYLNMVALESSNSSSSSNTLPASTTSESDVNQTHSISAGLNIPSGVDIFSPIAPAFTVDYTLWSDLSSEIPLVNHLPKPLSQTHHRPRSKRHHHKKDKRRRSKPVESADAAEEHHHSSNGDQVTAL